MQFNERKYQVCVQEHLRVFRKCLMKFCCAILFCMDLITATRACTAILQYVVGTNLSWTKEGEELVPVCKSVCGNMHAQTKPVSMLSPQSPPIFLYFPI